MIEYISITEAHEATGVPRSTLKRWCEREKIAGAKKVGRQWELPANWQRPALRRGNPNFKSKEKGT